MNQNFATPIIVTADPNYMNQVLASTDNSYGIVIADNLDCSNLCRVLQASVLLPDYKIMDMVIDQNTISQEAEMLYYNYLSSTAYNIILSIVEAIRRGKILVFYIPQEEDFGIAFSPYLLNYFRSNFDLRFYDYIHSLNVGIDDPLNPVIILKVLMELLANGYLDLEQFAIDIPENYKQIIESNSIDPNLVNYAIQAVIEQLPHIKIPQVEFYEAIDKFKSGNIIPEIRNVVWRR